MNQFELHGRAYLFIQIASKGHEGTPLYEKQQVDQYLGVHGATEHSPTTVSEPREL